MNKFYVIIYHPSRFASLTHLDILIYRHLYGVIDTSKTEKSITLSITIWGYPCKRLRVYTLHNSKKSSNSWLNKYCYCFFHRSGSKSLYFSSGVFGCHSMVFSMTSLMYSNRLMPFNLHEIAIEYRIAPRLAPSCEPKNIEFLLDSDMYLWILSM